MTARHRIEAIATALAAALLAACASPLPREQPLREVVKITAPKLAPGVRENSDELFVVVTFSGGGKRAAAFSFGVLEALRDLTVTVPGGAKRPLLDEIDIISAVSGGAFTAAYYSMHGYDTFADFPARFLEHDTAAAIRRVLLSPANWPRLMTSKVSRSDLAVEYLDRAIFDHATVADLIERSPRVIVTATDLVRAAPFAFTREQMNGVCMDPASVPLARAVFASADTPIYFAPLVMHNFAGRCGYRPPSSADLDKIREDEYYRLERARRLESFLDSKNYPYLHLADGALTDLHREMDDTHFHLLLFGLPQAGPGLSAGGLVKVHDFSLDADNKAALARAGLGEPGFCLVRPDGYVGLCGGAFDAAALAKYLAGHVHLKASLVGEQAA